MSTAQHSSARRPLTARTWTDVGVVVALAAIGLVGFEPSFGGYSFLVPALGGLVVGVATAVVASVFRLSVVTTIVAAVVAYFLCGTALAVPQQALLGVFPSLQSLSTLALGTVYGWADIVTLQTPIEAPQHITVVPYVATWVVALVSTTLATRWLTRTPRAAWRFGVVLLGPLAIYVASILIGTDDPYQAGVRGVGFAAIALVWLGWRRSDGSNMAQAGARKLRGRKIAGIAIVVSAAVLLGGGAGWWIAPAQDQRFVLRDEIEPPFDPLQYPSPLAGFRHYTKQVTDEVLFSVSGLKPGDSIRLATLDSFTGKLWNVTGAESSAEGSGTFSLVGRKLPRQSFITPETRTDVTFTIGAYADVWMPSIGYPTDLEFTAGDAVDARDSLRYNASTGTAVLTAGLHEGDSYTVDTTIQQVISLEDLSDVSTASVELPPVRASPDIVTAKAQEYAANATTPVSQLEAVRLALTTTGFLSHGRASDTVASRAGHGADRITDLLERTQMVGDQEQYASAFALMVRSFGYPARVVMGFAPEIVEGETVEVTGDDVTAWVEVAFDDVGWVVFNPTPDETDIPQEQTPKPQSEPQPQVRQPPRVEADAEDLLTPVELDESEEEEDDLAFSIPGWVYALGLSLLIPAFIIFFPLLIIGIYKARRARRRREASAPHDQVAGAWDELVDQYSELGYSVPPKATRVMVAEQLDAQVRQTLAGAAIGGDTEASVSGRAMDAGAGASGVALAEHAVMLRAVAVATDDAVFSGQEISPERSGEAWSTTAAAVEAGRAGLTTQRRVVSRYRIRSARDWASRVSTKSENSEK
ncbi:transglutaminase family protein [Salinibacterium sp. PAMC 21357]|uniref:transglutaminase family protein n=1 Tax=Salinibacterium sp. PAMC 21357 TaxID=1112215 RepID=UPI0011461F9C|nr:transglutaminase domain-containing protein [Salinibacterium sp. PAMC 21357]